MKDVAAKPFSNLYVKIDSKIHGELTRPMLFNHKHILIKIPQRFKTDFVTVPQFFWWYVYPTGLLVKPAVLHDYLYSKECKLRYSRKDADKLFLLAMKLVNINWFKRHIAYYSVRLFGRKYYKVD